MNKLAKAIVATATTVAGWIGTVTLPAEDGSGVEITLPELGLGLCSAVAAFFLVWAVPNDTDPKRRRSS